MKKLQWTINCVSHFSLVDRLLQTSLGEFDKKLVH